MENYLTVRLQRTKVINSDSSWAEIIEGVPQGSFLGPLLFNIFLNGLFLCPQETFLSNYTDNHPLFSIDNTIEGIKKALSNDFRIIQNWFHENFMVLNAKKCHYMCFGTSSENDDFILDGIIDNELKFDPHIKSMCKKAAAKVKSAKQNTFIIRS